MHSLLSDGTDTPEALVMMAQAAGLTTISITDHDMIDAIEPALVQGKESGLEIIPGIEFTTDAVGNELHILGYYIDRRNPQFLAALGKIQADRVARIYKIVEKLKEMNVAIEAEDVLSLSGKKAPGRPHVARAMIKKGIVGSFKEAFNRYLDSRGPAYVPHFKMLPNETIRLITDCGGIAVFAHPAVSDCDQLIPGLMADGLKGIEAYYSGHRPEQTEHYVGLAKKYGLLVTGGSDYHGENSGREIKLGQFTIPDHLVEMLRNEHLRGN